MYCDLKFLESREDNTVILTECSHEFPESVFINTDFVAVVPEDLNFVDMLPEIPEI